jgi:hypothetical protein
VREAGPEQLEAAVGKDKAAKLLEYFRVKDAQ